mmetsp:Transcript_25594/g.75513  ORF Transcript_25594/g.75513 Transcript_25594/m.75513 type:complete len:292 (+) Transcript_25594:1489-2364(+)
MQAFSLLLLTSSIPAKMHRTQQEIAVSAPFARKNALLDRVPLAIAWQNIAADLSLKNFDLAVKPRAMRSIAIASTPRAFKRSDSKCSKAPNLKYTRLFPQQYAFVTAPSSLVFSLHLSSSSIRLTTESLRPEPSGSSFFSSTSCLTSIDDRHLNRSKAVSCIKRFGNAERVTFTADMTPAQSNCSFDDRRFISIGRFSGLGLIQRMYLVLVVLKLSMRDPSCVLNFVLTVRDPFFLPLPAEGVAAFASAAAFSSVLMRSLELLHAHSKRSFGSLSMFFSTKLVASYFTTPA